MNKKNYINSMNQLHISTDFNERTAKRMKDTLSNNKKYNIKFNPKKLVFSLAGMAVIAIISTFAWNSLHSKTPQPENNIMMETEGITIPTITLPDASDKNVKADMIGLFVYKGRIYTQSNTNFITDEQYQPNKEDVLALRGDYLGTTKGNLDEWSTQEDYATEFASTIGESEVYTVNGYDKQYRLMAYSEYEGTINAQIYDSFGGLTLTSGADYFNLLHLKDDVNSLQWETYDSWNNGKNQRSALEADDAFYQFLDALYTSVPIGEDSTMFTDNIEPDSQKFLYIRTDSNLITTLRLFQNGYVYVPTAGFFQVSPDAFQPFWDSMPLNQTPAGSNPPSSDTAAPQTDVTVTLIPSSYPVGTSSITLSLTNHSKEELWYGMEYQMEQKIGDEWILVPAVQDLMFIEIAQSLAPDSQQDFSIDLSQLNPALEVGNYRILKTINGQDYYTEFELTK